MAESLFFNYHRKNNVDVRVARIFNTYGPRMSTKDGRVISNFVVQALRNEPFTVFGKGVQTRSFCYVDDLVEGLIRLMDLDDFAGPINLGNPVEYSVGELTKLIVELTGTTSQIDHQPLPQDDPTQRQPDISLAIEKLNWRPMIELREGLEKTIAYFAEVLAGA